MTHPAPAVRIGLLIISAALPAALTCAAVDQLEDLTAGVIPIVTLRERDNFANEFRYDVSVENRTSHPIKTEGLIVVVDQIIDLAGKDATNRIEVLGADGQMPDGKPYFKVPAAGAQLAPYTESEPTTVRLRNPYYTILFTPSFRVLGRQISPPRLPAVVPPVAGRADGINRLIEILIKKGVITREEWLGGSTSPSETK